jgi:hypothetical protein
MKEVDAISKNKPCKNLVARIAMINFQTKKIKLAIHGME